jgi:hypothetical protein
MAEINPWNYISSTQLANIITRGDKSDVLDKVNSLQLYTAYGTMFAVNIRDIDTGPNGFYFHFVIHDRDNNEELKYLDIHVTMHQYDSTRGNQFHIVVDRKDKNIRKTFGLNLTLEPRNLTKELRVNCDMTDFAAKMNTLFSTDDRYKTDMRTVIIYIIPEYMSNIFQYIETQNLLRNLNPNPHLLQSQQSYIYTGEIARASQYHKKYLKYKQKYLELKKQLNL